MKSFPKDMPEWQAIQDTYNAGEQPQIFRPEEEVEIAQPPMNYNQLAQAEAQEQGQLPELEMSSNLANSQGVPEDNTQDDMNQPTGNALQVPASRAEQLWQEYSQLMGKDREALAEARNRDRMLKLGAAAGDALATMLNARNQMNVAAPGVQVQQGAGLSKIADIMARSPEISDDLKARREDLLAQYKFLASGGEMTPYQRRMLELKAKDQQLREQQLEGIGTRFEKGLEFRKEEKNELSDKQLESIASFDKVDMLANDLRSRAAEFKDKLGPYAPTVEQAKNYVPGMQEDPDWAAFKATTTDQLSQYIKSLSGLTVSDKERAALLQSVPTVKDKYDIYVSKMDELQKRLEQYKNSELQAAKKYQGKNIKEVESALQKQLSPRDQQALDWANKNPNDPRADQIKRRLGM